MKKFLKRQLLLGLIIALILRLAQQLMLGGNTSERMQEDVDTNQLRDLSDSQTVQGLLDVIDELKE